MGSVPANYRNWRWSTAQHIFYWKPRKMSILLLYVSFWWRVPIPVLLPFEGCGDVNRLSSTCIFHGNLFGQTVGKHIFSKKFTTKPMDSSKTTKKEITYRDSYIRKLISMIPSEITVMKFLFGDIFPTAAWNHLDLFQFTRWCQNSFRVLEKAIDFPQMLVV